MSGPVFAQEGGYRICSSYDVTSRRCLYHGNVSKSGPPIGIAEFAVRVLAPLPECCSVETPNVLSRLKWGSVSVQIAQVSQSNYQKMHFPLQNYIGTFPYFYFFSFQVLRLCLGTVCGLSEGITPIQNYKNVSIY